MDKYSEENRDLTEVSYREVGGKSKKIIQHAKSFIERITSWWTVWHDRRTNEKDEKYFAWLGWQIIIWGLGTLFLWAIFAPIEKGISAPGFVITDSNRKTIQSPLPGIVEDILVKEGQAVKAGEILVRLNPISTQAQANATSESIGGFEAQANGLSQAILQKKQQSALLEKQLVSLRELASEGYMARNKVSDIERQSLQLKASILEDEGNLSRVRKQVSEQRERLNPFKFDLANTELKSPVDGNVVNIAIFTKGGVVSSGQKLMEVIPSNDNLIVEGQLPVHLVDKAKVDLPVEMLFTAFNINRTPHIPGVLISVGSDRTIDERTGNSYYKIQAMTTPEGYKLLKGLKVRPGMPVEIFVKTGERSMMSYLLKPIFDRAHSSLREE